MLFEVNVWWSPQCRSGLYGRFADNNFIITLYIVILMLCKSGPGQRATASCINKKNVNSDQVLDAKGK